PACSGKKEKNDKEDATAANPGNPGPLPAAPGGNSQSLVQAAVAIAVIAAPTSAKTCNVAEQQPAEVVNISAKGQLANGQFINTATQLSIDGTKSTNELPLTSEPDAKKLPPESFIELPVAKGPQTAPP